MFYVHILSIHRKCHTNPKDFLNLESTGHKGLKDTLGIILLRNIAEFLMILSTIAREDRLESSSITNVVESLVETGLLGSIVNLVRRLFDPGSDNIIISRANPLNHLRVTEINLRGVQAESVSAMSLGGLHPVRTDRLPVQLDSGDVGGRDLRVQLRELVEEGLIDDADAAEELLVACALNGSGDEYVTKSG